MAGIGPDITPETIRMIDPVYTTAGKTGSSSTAKERATEWWAGQSTPTQTGLVVVAAIVAGVIVYQVWFKKPKKRKKRRRR